ncbi:MAG: amylosucrase [Pseudomonadota bacterium]
MDDRWPAPPRAFAERLEAALPPALRESIALRLQRLAPDAVAALARLYGARADFSHWLERLADILGHALRERPAPLLALDARRARDEADWFQRPRMVGYTAYVDRFAGTIAGVADRIDYLKGLGVTYLHLLPLLKTRPGEDDGGFAVVDYRTVEPRLGRMADLKALADRLRDNGISLCLDLVANHTAREHDWARRAMAGDPVYRAYYHVFPDRVLPDQYERHLAQVFPHTAPGNFTYVPQADIWVWTTFYPYQWDLNYANPAVFAEMLDILLFLANQGVEVFRIDAAAYMWKELGTDCRSRPQTHVLLQALRALVAIAAPAVALKAEAIVEARQLAKYLGNGESARREAHLAYHNALMAGLWASLGERRADRLAAMLRDIPPPPPGTAWVTYARCHDDIGWGVLADPRGAPWSASGETLAFLNAFYAGTLPDSFARGAAFQPYGVEAADEGHLSLEHHEFKNQVALLPPTDEAIRRGRATSDPQGFCGSNGTLASLAGLEAAVAARDEAGIETALERIRLLHGVIFAFGGIPLISMGDELGLLNDYDFTRHGRGADGRWLHRPFMDWALAARRGDGRSLAGRLHAMVVHFVKARRGCPVLHAARACVILDAGNPHVLALRRGEGERSLVVLANFSDTDQEFMAPSAEALLGGSVARDALSGNACVLAQALRLAPYQVLWLVKGGDNDGAAAGGD